MEATKDIEEELKELRRQYEEIGDWGLGIGPNPQSPIPNPPKIII